MEIRSPLGSAETHAAQSITRVQLEARLSNHVIDSNVFLRFLKPWSVSAWFAKSTRNATPGGPLNSHSSSITSAEWTSGVYSNSSSYLPLPGPLLSFLLAFAFPSAVAERYPQKSTTGTRRQEAKRLITTTTVFSAKLNKP